MGILVLAVMATVGSVMRGRQHSGPPHTITVPASVDQYDRLTGSVADRLLARIRTAAANSSGDAEVNADLAALAVYDKKQGPDQ